MQILNELLLQTSTAAVIVLSLVKATVVLALGQLIVTVARDLSAATRHLILTAGLASFIVIPSLALLAPKVEVAVATAPPAAAPAATAAIPDSIAAPAPVGAAATSNAKSETPILPSITFTQGVAGVWMLVSLVLLSRLVRSAFRVRSIVRGSFTPSARLNHLLEEVRDRLGLDMSVRLLQSDRLDVPMVWGVRRGTLLLPEVAEEWTDEHVRATLIHELGHLQRLDYASLALMNVVSSLLWFHPQVWTARSRALTEGERACDDLVLRAGERASEYASHLLHVARLMPRREPLAALLAMSRPSQLEGRMYAILSTSVNRQAIGGKLLMLSLAAFLAVVVPLSVVQPVVAATEPMAMLVEIDRASHEEPATGSYEAHDNRKHKNESYTVNVDRNTGTCADYKHQFGNHDVQVRGEETITHGGRHLNVTASGNGGVRVRRATAANFSVIACKVAAADSEAEAAQVLSQVEVHERNGAVTVTGPHSGNWNVNLIVNVPDGTAIDVSAKNGPVSFDGVDATVKADVVNGPLAFANSRGEITARSKNGPLALASMSGNIDAAVTNGPLTIDLDDTWSGGELRASVENGPLALSVPKGFGSGVEVKTKGHAPFNCSLPSCRSLGDEHRSRDNRPRELSFGNGPARIFIESGNGPVTISE